MPVVALIKTSAIRNGWYSTVSSAVRYCRVASCGPVHFASKTPLADFPCLAVFSKSRRMVYAANFSAPELKRAPEGWYFYCGTSVPRPARGMFDE